MLKTYLVEYWTTTGQRIGVQIQALSALDAKIYAQSFPNFKTLVKYPTEYRN